ncbi:MAG TPA: hypothetical protein VMB18_14495 [Terriglobales bacterium]|nr:hypothetical protein [Terriglobales bacterium]
MDNCQVLKTFGSPDVESRVYGVLSDASGLAAHARNHTNILRIAVRLYNLNRSLILFLNQVHDILEGRKKPVTTGEPPTPEQLKATADSMEHVYRIIDYIYESGRCARLTNNRLTAGSLHSLKKHSEELLDLADWLETTLNAKYNNAAFTRASQEKESGDIYDLSEV